MQWKQSGEGCVARVGLTGVGGDPVAVTGTTLAVEMAEVEAEDDEVEAVEVEDVEVEGLGTRGILVRRSGKGTEPERSEL